MDIAVTGSNGLIGSALIRSLEADGHSVRRLVRGGSTGAGRVAWDPAAGTIDAVGLEGVDAVVHLAGEGIGERRWTPEQKQRILESRTLGTDLIARTIAGLPTPPRVLVSASAVGWYGGQRGDEVLTEASAAPATPDFLARVCVDWEAATAPAEAAGIRTVHLRTGIVLTPSGGALGRMVTPFKLGLGGRIGSGKQWMSWISIDDEVGAIRHALTTEGLAGAVNATAPEPVTNAGFTKALGAAVHRPTILPTPLTPLRAVYGRELVDALLVGGQRVFPAALEASGYTFAHRDLASGLRAVLDA
ncbi:MAG: TIGR01777 family oxidoreductase [Actinomycetes bacterium]